MSWRQSLRVAAVAVVLAGGVALAQGDDEDAAPPLPSNALEAARVVNAKLRSDEAEERARGLELLHWVAAERPGIVFYHLERTWLPHLLAAGMADDAAEVALKVILNDPANPRVGSVLAARTEALLAAQRWEQALAAAKSHYNVAALQDTNKSIDLVSRALANTLANEEPRIIARFRAQQAAWALETPAAGADDELGENVLSLIKVDAAPFDSAIAAIPRGNTYTTLTARGNLLLLADRPAEARAAFEQSVDLATSRQIAAAVSNIAKSIRAEHGAIAPANAYVLSLRGE